MKIINFKSGLGNQIYYYLFYLYLKDKYPLEKIYGCYNKKNLVKHNGVEVNSVFDLSIPPRTWYSDVISVICRKLSGLGFKGLKSTDKHYDENAIFFDGFYQDKKYFLGNVDNIKFREFDLGDKNRSVLDLILKEDSVFIHVRRGDYVDPKFIHIYGNICTDMYYQKAINMVLQKYPKAHFFVFSNDIPWVKTNLQIPNCTYVTHNMGKASFIDMFLMSKCKAGIMANSSFSFWGARLNTNKPYIIYPNKWDNINPCPDIFPKDWIAI